MKTQILQTNCSSGYGFSMPVTAMKVNFGNKPVQPKKEVKAAPKTIAEPKNTEKLTAIKQNIQAVKGIEFDVSGKATTNTKKTTFVEYYRNWLILHKRKNLTKDGMYGYILTGRWLTVLSGDLKINEVTTDKVKAMVSEYEKTHSPLMTRAFAFALENALMYAYNDKLISTAIEVVNKNEVKRYPAIKNNINHQISKTGAVLKTDKICKKIFQPKTLTNITRDTPFVEFFEHWIALNKYGKVTDTTFVKYRTTVNHLRTIDSTITISQMTRTSLQIIFDKFAETHAKQTTSSFIDSLYCAVIDAYDMDLLDKLPTRKFVNRGGVSNRNKNKFLSLSELQKLIEAMEFTETANFDYLILFMAKTGARYAEAMAITKADINVKERILTIDKTYNYKQVNGNLKLFQKTKTVNSVRNIVLDWHLLSIFQPILDKLQDHELLFGTLIHGTGRTYNCSLNNHLERLCIKAGVPVITSHGLRHTHASVLFANGVSIGMVSKRLGHASIDITQRVYLHVTQELEDKDNGTMTKALSGIY